MTSSSADLAHLVRWWRADWPRTRRSAYSCWRRAGATICPSIKEAGQWPLNIGSERDWAFMSQPNPHLNGRSIPLNMGKILGGGSSINLMGWARGHKNDWDFFAAEARDAAWSYESVLNI